MNPRTRRITLWLAGALLLPLLLLIGLALWASREGSLAQALRITARLLPADQQLVVTQVTGSVSRGGHLDALRWSAPGVTVTIEDLQLDWSLRELLGGELQVRRLSAQRLHVRTTPTPDKPDEPFELPADFRLPVHVELPVSIAHTELEHEEPPGTVSTRRIDALAAMYRYDGTLHDLQLSATLQKLVPDADLAMDVKASASGALAGGEQSAVDIRFEAQQRRINAPARVTAHATVHPWHSQPLQQLDLRLENLDAHAFNAGWPVTALGGQASLAPAARTGSWDAAVQIANDIAGPWDLQRLPMAKLGGRATITSHEVDVATARIDLGKQATAGSLMLQGRLPLADPLGTALQLQLSRIDLRQLLTTLPGSMLEGSIRTTPGPQGNRVLARVNNLAAGPADSGRIPVDELSADANLAADSWRITALEARAGAGRLHVEGRIDPHTTTLNLDARLQHLPLRALHRKLAADNRAELNGSAAVDGSVREGLAFSIDLAGSSSGQSPRGAAPWEIRRLSAGGSWKPERLRIDELHVDAFRANATGSGIDVALPGLESIKAKLEFAAPGLSLSTDAVMSPAAGSGRLAAQLTSAEAWMQWLRGLPGLGAQLSQATASGSAKAQLSWQGSWQQWRAGIRNPRSQPGLQLLASVRSEGLAVSLPASATRAARKIRLDRIELEGRGNPGAASLNASASAAVDDFAGSFDLNLHATQAPTQDGAAQWNLVVEKLSAATTLPGNGHPWTLNLEDRLQVTARTGKDVQIEATAGSLTLAPPSDLGAATPLQISWQPTLWRRTAQGALTLRSAGAIKGIQPAWLDTLLADKGEGPLTAAGMRTDLSMSADWNAELTDRIAILAHLQRESGDLWLDAQSGAGIRALDLQLRATDERLEAVLDWNSEHAGVITAQATTRITRQAGGWNLAPDAPLSGSITARLEDLSTLTFLAPPGWRIQGKLATDLHLSGTVQAPQLEGPLEGSDLNLRSVLDGVDLYHGTLRAALHDSRLEIADLTFEGGTGSRAYVRGYSGNRASPPRERGRMVARGRIDWSRLGDTATAADAGSGLQMALQAELQRMQVLVRHDRQMTLSGKLSANLDEGLLKLRGDLQVDRASIVLPEAGAPTLGDDVVIRRGTALRNAGAVEARQARGELETRRPLDMEIRLDLGRDLALEGQGITTRLEGELTVRSTQLDSNEVRVFGEVRTVEGRYRAWGQALNVETGVVRFNGPYDNPALDLLAIRPNIDVRAGVKVSGTLLAPRIQLFSEPDLPEGEKLSWVVLGRAAVTGSTEGSSMQQAALGLAAGQLGGKLASGLGLDELGLSEAGVSVGKRITNELYLTYQQGLAGAASTLFIFYDITRKLTLRAQASEASAIDLVYTIKYD